MGEMGLIPEPCCFTGEYPQHTAFTVKQHVGQLPFVEPGLYANMIDRLILYQILHNRQHFGTLLEADTVKEATAFCIFFFFS